jgi:hypothetical protein
VQQAIMNSRLNAGLSFFVIPACRESFCEDIGMIPAKPE